MSATYAHRGLPDGVKPFDLPDMLQKLRTRLGLRDEDITYIRYLLRKVRADDFKPDRICAVWEGVATQASDLGFHARRITRIATRLESRGLILRTASKGGRRFGRRGPDGRIVAAGGINLGPLIEKAGDLLYLIRREVLASERLTDQLFLTADATLLGAAVLASVFHILWLPILDHRLSGADTSNGHGPHRSCCLKALLQLHRENDEDAILSFVGGHEDAVGNPLGEMILSTLAALARVPVKKA